MKILITISLIFFTSANTKATTLNIDTTHPTHPYKISRKEFLNDYGKDDTSRAIINFYFKERRTALWLTSIGVSLTTFLGIRVNNVATSPYHEVELGYSELLDFVLIFGTGFFTLFGFYSLLSHSRKRLLEILNNYFSGRGIPNKLKRKLPLLLK